MLTLQIVDVWDCGPEALAIDGHGRAVPPDFRGAVICDQGTLLELRIDDGLPPRAAPETVYLIGGRGLYRITKRVEWLGIGSGLARALLFMTAV